MVKVVIIGGGCAGLGAAQLLLKNKQHVTLVDAYERFGGRAWTRPDQGFPFDLGPQFIQDPEVNPWTGIAKSLDFELLPRDDKAAGTYYRVQLDGVWQDRLGTPGINEVQTLLDEGYASAEQSDNVPPIAQSPGASADAVLALGSSQYGSIAESAEPWQYIAADRERQAEGSGKVQFVKDGIGTLVNAYGHSLQKSFPDTLTLHPATVVSAVRLRSAENLVRICAGEQVVGDYDYCIVTVPCSAIAGIAFEPPLTFERTSALTYVLLGSYKKVAFCPKQMPDAIAPSCDYYVYDGALGGCWQYFRLPTAPQALICVASGNFAHMLDRMDDETVVAALFKVLNAAYAPAEIVPPQKPMLTNWSMQPHIRGAYSFTRYDGGNANDPTALNARLELGKPHGGGRILFAGEATWVDAYGTIHGAFYSGERAATTILQQAGWA
ncbi:NAD(P)-binding protein [Bradyrhizobium sp. 83012]|uniref:Tryptophan 2-monooxygenase n=1 Tax=Bradyrhizobium aeschynomenes TaxID=2734909 RepID=A0ABX2C5L5_9BRAD|nr:NAD(P)/FAD-dependent oxidoreductase [Bradyrhizobium aeschynomenes]NPU63587.1 NAD(P)-binding protein [Bradyrhizobium aeschynomenes]